MTDEAIYQTALQTAVNQGYLDEPGALAGVELSLALHAATPKIEAFYQHYLDHQAERNTSEIQNPTCGSWVDWYGTTVCDLETLVHLAGIETIDSSNKTSSHP